MEGNTKGAILVVTYEWWHTTTYIGVVSHAVSVMKNTILILIVVGLLSCGDRNLGRFASPSGLYSLDVELGNKDNPSDRYILMFKLRDRAGEELDHLRTGASDVMKWSVTWVDKNTIILYSQDIGTYAWTIDENQKFFAIENVPQEMINIASEAFNKKYNR